MRTQHAETCLRPLVQGGSHETSSATGIWGTRYGGEEGGELGGSLALRVRTENSDGKGLTVQQP